MTLFPIRALFVLVLTTSVAAAAGPAGPSNERDAMEAVAKYGAVPECEGKELSSAELMIKLLQFIEEGDIAARKARDRSRGARVKNALGNAALEKKCYTVARRLFLEVIDEYTGSAYASLRQRAQIGIDDVRVAQAATPR